MRSVVSDTTVSESTAAAPLKYHHVCQVRATLMRALYIVLFSTPMVFGSMFALAVFFVSCLYIGCIQYCCVLIGCIDPAASTSAAFNTAASSSAAFNTAAFSSAAFNTAALLCYTPLLPSLHFSVAPRMPHILNSAACYTQVRGYVFLEISTLVYEVAAMTALLELVIIREGGDEALIRFAASRSGQSSTALEINSFVSVVAEMPC